MHREIVLHRKALTPLPLITTSVILRSRVLVSLPQRLTEWHRLLHSLIETTWGCGAAHSTAENRLWRAAHRRQWGMERARNLAWLIRNTRTPYKGCCRLPDILELKTAENGLLSKKMQMLWSLSLWYLTWSEPCHTCWCLKKNHWLLSWDYDQNEKVTV